MKKEDYTNYTTDDLIKKEKTAKAATILLGVMIFLQFLVGLFLSYNQGFSIFVVLPFTFLPIWIINISTMKKIRAEIDSRNKTS
jgi:cytochrome b561